MTSGGEASRGAPSQGRPPLALTVPAAVAVAFLALPVIGVLVKAPWSSLGDVLSSPDARTSLRLSLETTSITTVCCIVLGVPLAWLLARTSFRGRGVVRALVTLPLVMPPVVGGVALLLAFGRNGVVGKYLDSWFGITLPFTTPAVIVAQTFVALPFMVISVEGAFRASDVRYDGATITFAGNFPGTTRTMPTQVYLALQSDPDAAIALSLALIVVSVAVLIALRERWLSGVAA